MTYENCKRLAEHCSEKGDEAGAKMYEDKATHKLTLPKYAHLRDKPKEVKKDGKK